MSGRTSKLKEDQDQEDQDDYVEVEDEDGTILTSKTYGSGLPSPGTSNSNIMHVKFHTDGDTTRTGWRLEWNEQ